MKIIKDTIKIFAKGLFNPDNKLSLIPNWLSFSRVIGGVLIPVFAYTNAPLELLFGSISFLAISDFLDGKAARIIAKKETKEGAMMDAICDKIFSVLLVIGILPILPIYAINGLLEGVIALINGSILSKGGNPKSNILGKIKIWPLSIGLIFGYMAAATQSLNIQGINEILLNISSALSLTTIPLQAINIKQYYEEYQRQTKPKEIEKSIEKINKPSKPKEKKPSFSLSRDKHIAAVYELEKEEPKKTEKARVYMKKGH